MTKVNDNALLSIRDLSIDFLTAQGVRHAVCGIDLDIGKGEIVALVGESGSGKSVTAAAITRLLPTKNAVAKGTIIFDGYDMLDLSESELEQVRGSGIAMIFQNPLSSLDPSFTIGAQLKETLRHRNGQRKRDTKANSRQYGSNEHPAFAEHRALDDTDITETDGSRIHSDDLDAIAAVWLRRVGIEDATRVLAAYPHQLSGGMRQRVMIAMAVSNHPRLLIADEPTTALDTTLQKEILALLKKLNRELGIAILMITHDFGVVSFLSDRVAVMNSGRIVEQGGARSLLAAPVHPYTQLLINAVPEIGLRRKNPSASRRLGQGPIHAGETKLGSPKQHAADADIANAAPTASTHLRTIAPPVLLEVRGLSNSFVLDSGWQRGEKKTMNAVIDVDLDVRRGEIFGIIGTSGSGKSTLARLIAQLIEPTRGSVRFDGQSLANLSAPGLRDFRRRFQFVFQDSMSSLNPRRTIADQLCDPALRLGVARNRRDALTLAVQALESVGLSAHYLARFPHALSGGQRQRVGIARALAVKPEFIVLDEPTSALDVSIQAQVLNLLLELRQSLDLTYLFIGHSLPVIEFLCDRVAVMEHGRIIETFNAIDFQSQTFHPSTRRLIDAILPIRVSDGGGVPLSEDTCEAVGEAIR